MQVPLEWLKQYVPVEASAEEVGARLTMGGLEVESIETSPIGPVLDVYVTPNRGDCLSLLGVGRELAALYNVPLNMPLPPPSQAGGPAAEQTSVVVEEPLLCPRYAARLVRDVTVGPSPKWLQDRLEAAGQRPINNVVDVTNYVMLELGQPLHAFDLHRLKEERIVVRRARQSETITTLDGVVRSLTPDILVIADAERAVAVAGVMGGAESEVSETTTNLLLESAHFDALSVRRTSRALGLRTEASYRFERVVDPDGVARALDRACELLTDIGRAVVISGRVDVAQEPTRLKRIKLRVVRAAQLLGCHITPDIARNCLTRLGLRVVEEDEEGTLDVEIPTFRTDLTQEEDLVEEVGRIYGYENLPETLPAGIITGGGDSKEGRLLTRIRIALAGIGLQEIVTHSLTAPSFFDTPEDAMRRVPIRNALSAEVSGLRRSLLPNLIEIARHNVARGTSIGGLFEIGRVWQSEGEAEEAIPREYLAVAGLFVGSLTSPDWQRGGKTVVSDFYTARGAVERLLADLHIDSAEFVTWKSALQAPSAAPQFHPGRTALISLGGLAPIGVVGELHPRLAAGLPFRDRVYLWEVAVEGLAAAMPSEGLRFQPMSRFPAVSRDIAPRVAVEVPFAAVEEAIEQGGTALLEEMRLTDVFVGAPLPEGTKSLTLSFTFRSNSGTLTDAEVNEALATIRALLEARCGATFAS